MTIRQSRVCGIVFAGALAVAAPALAQPADVKERVPGGARITRPPAELDGLRIAGDALGALNQEGLRALEGLGELKSLSALEDLGALKSLSAL